MMRTWLVMNNYVMRECRSPVPRVQEVTSLHDRPLLMYGRLQHECGTVNSTLISRRNQKLPFSVRCENTIVEQSTRIKNTTILRLKCKLPHISIPKPEQKRVLLHCPRPRDLARLTTRQTSNFCTQHDVTRCELSVEVHTADRTIVTCGLFCMSNMWHSLYTSYASAPSEVQGGVAAYLSIFAFLRLCKPKLCALR